MALTPAQRKDLRDRLIKGIKNTVAGDPGNTLGGQPVEDFLAGLAPSNPFSRFQYDAGQRTCRRWAAGRAPSIVPGRDIYFRNLCQPYIEQNFGALGPATSEPPFVGGQCSFRYVVGTKGTICPTGPTDVVGFAAGNGPISAITRQIISNNPVFGQFRFIWTVQFSDGPETFTIVRTSQTPEPCVGIFPSNSANVDNCGNLPDDFNPGSGPTIPPETGPIPSPPGWDIPDFDIDITLNPDGTINVTFGDGDPDVTIDPGGEDSNPSPAPAPGDQGQPGTPSEAGESDAEGEAPAGSVLVGLRLQLIAAPPNAKTFAPVVYRGAAYIYMGGDVGLDQDYAGSMLVADQFIYAEKDNLTRWKVISNQGFRWNVTPYFRDFEP